MADPLDELSSRGVSVWLDDLSRQRLTTGSLAGLVARDHVVGVTTNPTIFAKAISGGDGAYAEARQVLSQLATLGIDYDEVTARLEEHGLETFDASWRELSDQLATALRCPCENHPA